MYGGRISGLTLSSDALAIVLEVDAQPRFQRNPRRKVSLSIRRLHITYELLAHILKGRIPMNILPDGSIKTIND